MTILAWRSAEQGDRSALQRFTCTTEGRRRPEVGGTYWHLLHPYPYERVVQSKIRDCRPPWGAGQDTLLGLEGGEIKAVAHFSHGAMDHINMIAVSRDAQGQGLGREAMDVVIDQLSYIAQDRGETRIRITADTHKDNARSVGLLAGFKFQAVAGGPQDHQRWGLAVHL